MRKILLRTLLLCAMIVVLLVPAVVSALGIHKQNTVTTTGDKKYSVTLDVHLSNLPADTPKDQWTTILTNSRRLPDDVVKISSINSDRLRVKFALLRETEFVKVTATVSKNGVEKTVDLSYESSLSLSTGTYNTYVSTIDGTVKQVDIYLKHKCVYDSSKEVTTEPTCTEDGTITNTCIYCAGTTTTSNGTATGHAFTKKLVDAKYLQSSATCTEDAVYVYSCCYCGEAGTETFKDTGTATGHDWGEFETITAPTCTTAGEKTRTCKTCQATDTEAISATGHEYTTTKEDQYLKTAATCAADAVYYKSCSKCGLKSDEETFTAEGTKTSDHTWGEYTTTKAATCTEKGTESRTCTVCNETESRDIEATGHDWSEYKTTTASICTKAGVETRTCTKCNAKESRELPLAAHDFTKEDTSEKYLKSAATCTSGAVYYKSCSVCGATGTDTFVSGDPIAHTWGEYVTTTQATCTGDGVKTRTCSVCKAQETAKISATGHQYSDYVSDNNATCTEDGTKTATCTVCSDKHTVADPGSAKGHTWDSGVVTKEPTEDETGVKTFTCTGCSTTRTEVIPVKEHTHAYTESVVNDNTLAQSATCTSAARYYKSCKCGDISRDATFESGSPLPHKFTNYVYDGNATCTADGTKTATCDFCGQAKDTVKADGTATGHLWDKGQVTVEPTVDHEGEMTYTCQNCHETKTETLAKLEPEKPNPVDPTPADPSKDNTAAGNQTLTASTDAAKNLEKQTETPRTSDDSALMLWTALLLLSGISLTSAGLIRRCR